MRAVSRPVFLVSALALGGAVLLGTHSCTQEESGPTGLLLAQAPFNSSFEPQAAQVLTVLPPSKIAASGEEQEPWTYGTFHSSQGSDVFHKAMVFDPVDGDPGILTISANPPYLELFRKEGDAWTGTVLWTGEVGDVDTKRNRLRDVEIADVDGDGQEEIVLVSHNRGIVMIVEQSAELPYQATEIDRSDEEHWIHEVEVGDVDGDGQVEIFATPSEPNKLDGSKQAGWLKIYRREGDQWKGEVLKEYTERHVKEILCTDLFGAGEPNVLIASLEGEGIGGAGGANVELELFRWKDGKAESEMIVELKGKLCRFLCAGDTDGDGRKDIIASTYKDGIFAVSYDGSAWSRQMVSTGFTTASFEHATYLFDWDGDGKDDIFVASDDQKRLHRFFYDEDRGRYAREHLLDLPVPDGGSVMTFNLMPYPNAR